GSERARGGKRGASATSAKTATPARTRSMDSKTAHASKPGSYQSTKRLTSRAIAPRATSAEPASKRSRKGPDNSLVGGGRPSEADAPAAVRGPQRDCQSPVRTTCPVSRSTRDADGRPDTTTVKSPSG